MLIKKEGNITKVFQVEVLGSMYQTHEVDIINGKYENIERGRLIGVCSNSEAMRKGFELEEEMKKMGYVEILD